MNFEDFTKSTCMFCGEDLIKKHRYIRCADRFADHLLEIDPIDKEIFITLSDRTFVVKINFLDETTTFCRFKDKLMKDYIIDFQSLNDIEKQIINIFDKYDIFK